MCGRYTLTRKKLGEVIAYFEAAADPSAEALRLPRFNAAPSQACLIARAGDEAVPVLTAARWGLELGERFVINLRAEAATRYKRLLPCVIPADGFYEWTGKAGHKRPIWFHRPKREMFLIAGLLAAADDGPPSFAVMTGPALAPVLEIHDRTPLILDAKRARTWLAEGGEVEPVALRLVGREVSPRANSARNDDAALLERVAPKSGHP